MTLNFFVKYNVRINQQNLLMFSSRSVTNFINAFDSLLSNGVSVFYTDTPFPSLSSKGCISVKVIKWKWQLNSFSSDLYIFWLYAFKNVENL